MPCPTPHSVSRHWVWPVEMFVSALSDSLLCEPPHWVWLVEMFVRAFVWLITPWVAPESDPVTCVCQDVCLTPHSVSRYWVYPLEMFVRALSTPHSVSCCWVRPREMFVSALSDSSREKRWKKFHHMFKRNIWKKGSFHLSLKLEKFSLRWKEKDVKGKR